MYEYLIGILIGFLVWLLIFYFRRDLRKAMIWTGFFYLIFTTLTFFLYILLANYEIGVALPVVPSYWNPDTLFDLSRFFGLSLEDLLFMFFAGGVGAGIYEIVFKRKIKFKKRYKLHWGALITTFIVAMLFPFLKFNLMYSLIVPPVIGTLVMWYERKDLIKHSLKGGLAFLIFYILALLAFFFIFPDFVEKFYTLQGVSGILVLGIPLEEFLYAFAFGLLWAPMYEYVHGEKEVRKK
ncbi:MAG: lycopene cyclase domain-containing protein [Nanoarchaeota archaeon]